MSATISDYFNKASDGSGTYPVAGTVSATRSAGGTTLTCEDLTGWTTDTPVHFSTYRLNQEGKIDTSTETDWKGIVSGDTITNLTRVAGAADTGNSIGDIVLANPTIGWLDDLVKGLLVSHLQTGALKDGVVTAGKLASNAVTTEKINSGAVTTAKIASGAVTADNIDFSTIAHYEATATNFAYTTSWAAKTSVTIEEAGTYLLLGILQIGNLSGGYLSTQFYNNTKSEVIGQMFQCGTFTGASTSASNQVIATLDAGTKVELRGVAGSALSASPYHRANLIAVRIG